IKMTVAMRDQFAGALGRGIEGNRRVDAVLDAERLLLVRAIDRGRTRIDETIEPWKAAGRFEQDHLAHDVAVDIGVRVLQRVAHAGLCREMDDPRYVAITCEHFGDTVAVGDVDLVKDEIRIALEPFETSLLQPDAVVLVQIVDANDRLAPLGEAACDMKADEARGPGDENAHLTRHAQKNVMP